MVVPPENVPPRESRRRRYWSYYQRPYTGCGWLYTLFVILLFWWLLSLLFPTLGVWRRYLY
ncbi:MAG TPA: hypothetical protein VD966_04210 [Pyrinomonadaceae bacterium]|nr:hypothetical protein [Pyrinomonadaceae bacterium]